jgi:TRAP-type C4-dicarboxylate transport system permease large subunit
VLTGRLDKEKILDSLLQATRTAAAVFTVLIGALIFGYFLTVTQTPQKVTSCSPASASAPTASSR